MIRGLKDLPEKAAYGKVCTPSGEFTIVASTDALLAVLWEGETTNSEAAEGLDRIVRDDRHEIVRAAGAQLTEYFRGDRREFDLPVQLHGTPFQCRAWHELMKVSYGETISYAEQARRMGAVSGARAVGLANAVNPITIIVPCHRVIGKSGHLTGYGAGLEKKKYLLELESRDSRLI
jgi:methylated-DNA-[protein]-cysteine S-methyltransferase